jgi:hypothetical protein
MEQIPRIRDYCWRRPPAPADRATGSDSCDQCGDSEITNLDGHKARAMVFQSWVYIPWGCSPFFLPGTNKTLQLSIKAMKFRSRITIQHVSRMRCGRALVSLHGHACGVLCVEGLAVDPARDAGAEYFDYSNDSGADGTRLAGFLGAHSETMCEVLHLTIVRLNHKNGKKGEIPRAPRLTTEAAAPAATAVGATAVVAAAPGAGLLPCRQAGATGSACTGLLFRHPREKACSTRPQGVQGACRRSRWSCYCLQQPRLSSAPPGMSYVFTGNRRNASLALAHANSSFAGIIRSFPSVSDIDSLRVAVAGAAAVPGPSGHRLGSNSSTIACGERLNRPRDIANTNAAALANDAPEA